MKTLTVKEFFESKEELFVNVSKEEYDTYARAFDEAGYKWGYGQRYTEWNPWDKATYGNNICLDNKRTLISRQITAINFDYKQVELDLEPVQTVAEWIDENNDKEKTSICARCYNLKNNKYRCASVRCSECEFHKVTNISKMLQEPITNYIKPQPFKKDTIIEVSNDNKIWNLGYFEEFKNGYYCTCDSINAPMTICRSWKYARLPKGIKEEGVNNDKTRTNIKS